MHIRGGFACKGARAQAQGGVPLLPIASAHETHPHAAQQPFCSWFDASVHGRGRPAGDGARVKGGDPLIPMVPDCDDIEHILLAHDLLVRRDGVAADRARLPFALCST